jgi:hypothetical protein
VVLCRRAVMGDTEVTAGGAVRLFARDAADDAAWFISK